MVEDEDVGESGKDEVKDQTEKPGGLWSESCADYDVGLRGMERVPCNEIKAQELPAYVVPPPFTHVGISRRGELEELGGRVYWRRQLPHAGKGCSSIFDIVFCIRPTRCRVDIGPKAVKKEGITNFKDDIHCEPEDHNKDNKDSSKRL